MGHPPLRSRFTSCFGGGPLPLTRGFAFWGVPAAREQVPLRSGGTSAARRCIRNRFGVPCCSDPVPGESLPLAKAFDSISGSPAASILFWGPSHGLGDAFHPVSGECLPRVRQFWGSPQPSWASPPPFWGPPPLLSPFWGPPGVFWGARSPSAAASPAAPAPSVPSAAGSPSPRSPAPPDPAPPKTPAALAPAPGGGGGSKGGGGGR